MFIKDRWLLGGLLLLAVIVGLLVTREIKLGYQYRGSAQVIARFNSMTAADNSSPTPAPQILASDILIGQGNKQLFFFGDFTCEACRTQWQLLRSWQTKKPKDLTIIWKDTLDVSNQESLQAAIMARCAGTSFVKMADRLFEQNGRLTAGQPQTLVKEFGLSASSFTSCQKDPTTIDLIQNNVQEAIRLGLTQTPTVYVDNHWYIGGLVEAELQNL